MPNILKRPMFSRGGASQGTGVTSGLDKQKALIDYVSQLKREAQPTTRQRIGDFLTAFGASKGLDLGASLADTGKNFAALSAKRQDRADKYNAVLDSQLLKLFGSSEALTAASKNAREFARLNYKDYPGKTDQEKYKAAYKAQLNRILNKTRAEISLEEEIREEVNKIERNEIYPSGLDVAPIARTKIAIRRGKIKLGKGGKETFSDTIRKGDIIQQGDGSIAIFNPKKPPASFRRYETNKFYIAIDGSVYQYQGKKTFKRVYP
jgi:hypothetical protein